jgi:predicted nucleic acid-binding protein
VAKFTVIFDACVLYPAPLRDLLMQLATTRLFRAKWTAQIHDEWIRNVIAERRDLTRGQLDRTRQLMDRAVRDCLVTGHEYLIPSVTLPDPDDRHVVAAAIHARADAIVTANLKDFPAQELIKYHLEAIHPDDFITNQFDLSQAEVVVAAQQCRARLKNPPKSAEEYVETLQSLSLPKTAAALRGFVTVL